MLSEILFQGTKQYDDYVDLMLLLYRGNRYGVECSFPVFFFRCLVFGRSRSRPTELTRRQAWDQGYKDIGSEH